jgi:hypothetical protein
VQPKSAGDLCTQDPVLLTKVINNLLLLLIHLAGNGDEQDTQGVEGPGHQLQVTTLLCSARSSCWTLRHRVDQFSVQSKIKRDLSTGQTAESLSSR